MKIIRSFSAALIFSILCLTAQAQAPPSADKVLQEALQIAAAENKNVMIMFTASWCIWCKKMDASMTDSTTREYFNSSFVTRHLVVDESAPYKHLENPGATAFRTKYFGEGHGIPFWLIFDKEGKLLADSKMREKGEGIEKGVNAGCPATEKEVDYFISVLEKTSSISKEQTENVRKRFRRNDPQ